MICASTCCLAIRRHRVFVASKFNFLATKLIFVTSALVFVFTLSGCRESAPQFDANRVHALSLEISRDVPTDAAMEDVSAVIAELFGTPQTPRWPIQWMTDEGQQNLVSIERLEKAAGGVTSDQANAHTGLYQEHCVICHGITGSGAGPASRYQAPYPRDFRAGVFKWKSTPRSDKPTRQDLMRLLVAGIPGAPMPSFSLLPPTDREALVDYVIYLSVRGEVERKLLASAIDDLDYEDSPPSEDLRLRWVSSSTGSANQVGELTEGGEVIAEVIESVVERWVEATSSPVPEYVVPEGEQLAAAIARGKDLFHGQIANCAGCHGSGGAGGLPTLDYDDWTKDFTTRIGITPEDADAVKPFRKAGALPPRKLDPRVLAGGLMRGGNDRETLFRRVQHGIAGTPMPSLDISVEAEGKTGLSPTQAWDLVEYVNAISN